MTSDLIPLGNIFAGCLDLKKHSGLENLALKEVQKKLSEVSQTKA